jgi:uncharacterized damage-inducible protein DinB
MNGIQAVDTALRSTQHLLNWFLADLSDEDLLVRPVEAANHIAWQLGHLILSERQLVGQQLTATYPDLPSGFAELHKSADSSAQFLAKAAYLDLFNQTRQATLDAVSKLTDADLDRVITGPMATFAPNLGALLLLTSNHTLMHAGQFSVIRRKLAKPVLF